ncbi:MAG: cysteine desulfurase NifS, partial [Bacteroidota bacterium]
LNTNIDLAQLEEIVISSGSACDTNDLSPSHVLRSMGIKIFDIKNTIRVSFGTRTSLNDIKFLVDTLWNYIMNIIT